MDLEHRRPALPARHPDRGLLPRPRTPHRPEQDPDPGPAGPGRVRAAPRRRPRPGRHSRDHRGRRPARPTRASTRPGQARHHLGRILHRQPPPQAVRRLQSQRVLHRLRPRRIRLQHHHQTTRQTSRHALDHRRTRPRPRATHPAPVRTRTRPLGHTTNLTHTPRLMARRLVSVAGHTVVRVNEPTSRGVLYPYALPHFTRLAPLPEARHLLRHVWIPEWDVPAGAVSRQVVLAYPASNIVVRSDRVTLSGPRTGISTQDLTGRG